MSSYKLVKLIILARVKRFLNLEHSQNGKSLARTVKVISHLRHFRKVRTLNLSTNDLEDSAQFLVSGL